MSWSFFVKYCLNKNVSLFLNCEVDKFLLGTVKVFFFHHKTSQKKFFKGQFISLDVH